MRLDLTQPFQHFIVLLFSLWVAELASCILLLHLFFHSFLVPVSLSKFLVNKLLLAAMRCHALTMIESTTGKGIYSGFFVFRGIFLLEFGVFLLGFPPKFGVFRCPFLVSDKQKTKVVFVGAYVE